MEIEELRLYLQLTATRCQRRVRKQNKMKGRRTFLEAMNMLITLVVVVVSQVYPYVRLIKLYTLNTCSFLYINYISIKLLKKTKLKQNILK